MLIKMVVVWVILLCNMLWLCLLLFGMLLVIELVKDGCVVLGVNLDVLFLFGNDVDGKFVSYVLIMFDSVSVVLVELNGIVLLLYLVGFDIIGLCKDLQKVIC